MAGVGTEAIVVLVGSLLMVLITSVLVAYILSLPNRWLYILDQPNARSLHHRPTPRTGGIAVLAAIAVGIGTQALVGGTLHGCLWMLSVIPIALISFMDDRRGVGVLPRLLVHCLAAGMLLAMLGPGEPWILPVLGEVPAFISLSIQGTVVVWMINLYNFMDGMDGFAGGMALIGFSALAILGGIAGSTMYMKISLVIAIASGGFLVWNFPPARLFLGDVGSSSLGFLMAGMLLWGQRNSIVHPGLGLLVFSPFVIDASVTLLLRLGRGERIWEAHREHFYQRVVRLGWGHRRTVLAEYGLMLGCALSVIITATFLDHGQWFVLVIWGGVYVLLANVVRHMERKRVQ